MCHLKADCNYSAVLKMMRSTGMKQQRLEHSRNDMKRVLLASFRDGPKPLFPVLAVTETAAETTFSVLAETETTPKL